MRGAAERGRGQDAPLPGVGLATGLSAPQTCSVLGCCPTVVRAVRSTAGPSGAWFPGARFEVRISPSKRDDRVSSAHVAGFRPSACKGATCRARSFAGASSRGEESQESTDPAPQSPARDEEPRERTPGGRKASKRACRRLTGEPGSDERPIAVDARKRARRNGLATRGAVVPARASGEPSGEPRQRVGAVAKAV